MVSMQPECEPDLDKMAQQEKFIKVKKKNYVRWISV